VENVKKETKVKHAKRLRSRRIVDKNYRTIDRHETIYLNYTNYLQKSCDK